MINLAVTHTPALLHTVFNLSSITTHTGAPTKEKLSALHLLSVLSEFSFVVQRLVVEEEEFIDWLSRSDEAHQSVMELKYKVADNVVNVSGAKSILKASVVRKLETKLGLGVYHFTGVKQNFDVVDGV